MAENYYHVVAFTGKGLRGNPAGVCLLTQPLPAERLQAIANEIGLPETSFVWDDGDMTAIRWFTPEREVDLCGHGTLAAANCSANCKGIARCSAAMLMCSCTEVSRCNLQLYYSR